MMNTGQHTAKNMATHQTATALVFSALLSISVSTIGWGGGRISPEITLGESSGANSTCFEQLVNHSGIPRVPLGSPVSLWITFTVTPESQINRNVTVEWCSVVKQSCTAGNLTATSNTYTSSVTYNMIDEGDFGPYHVRVCGEMLNLTFGIDYEGPVCENNTVLPIASFITRNVAADETVQNISLFCVFHGDIMDVNFQICFNSTILDVPHNTCSSANPKTNNYYFNRTNLNCTSVGEITIKNRIPAGDYNYSCNAVSTNTSAHLPPGNILDSKLSIFARPEYRTILPLEINFKMNENISLTWIIYGKDVPNYYDINVMMDTRIMVKNMYTLKTYNCGEIALVDLEVNPTNVNVDWDEMHQFVLCAVLKSGELGTDDIVCTNSTNVKAFNDSPLQDWVNNNFGLVFGFAIAGLVGSFLFVTFIIIVGIIICYNCFKGKSKCCQSKKSSESGSSQLDTPPVMSPTCTQGSSREEDGNQLLIADLQKTIRQLKVLLRLPDQLKTKEPERDDLQLWLKSMAVEWEELGTSLKVDSGVLASFKVTQGSHVKKLMDVLYEWKTSQCSSYNFEQLISSLCDIDRFDVADIVVEKLKTASILRKYT